MNKTVPLCEFFLAPLDLYRPNECAACGHPLGLHEKNGCAWAVPGVLGWIPCMCKEGR